jgi:cysteinyl-tRNA synthetase
MLKLYNTLTRKLEEFKPLSEKQVTFYHCGPTVYWTQHIGNLRAMTMGDLLVRTLRYLGYEVKHVRNYTDVGHLVSDADIGEDKMEKGVKREGMTPSEIANKYIKIFEDDTAAINIVEPTVKPRATEYVGEMIKMVQELLDKGFAYTTDLAVYFDVRKFPNYTELSHQKMDMLAAGEGKANVSDPLKKYPADFALWFFRTGAHANALQYWPSLFKSKLVENGIGFPGWHIECSAMIRALLGKTIDIHFGGVEHIPVHHTNEIAQSEAVNGVKFVDYWLHNEHLVVNDEKMAKSTGTGYSLAEIVDHGFDPLTLRYFFLTAQYRTRQNFTWEALKSAGQSLTELREQVQRLKVQNSRTTLSEEKLEKIDTFRQKFISSLENDLNIPQALAVAWEVVKSNIPSPDKYDLIIDFDRVLGLKLSEFKSETIVDEKNQLPAEIIDLIKIRDELRVLKKFDESDDVRKQIEAKGFFVQDTENGTFVRKRVK